jgi:hypothetical protein
VMIGLIVFILNSGQIIIELKILIIVVLILIIAFFVWLLLMQSQEKPGKKITQVVIDRQGVHDYSDQDLVRTLKYSELMPNPENGEYDILIPKDQNDTDITVCFYLFDDVLNKIRLQEFRLNVDDMIINGKSLKKHFLKGIIIFRPDLKIDPGVFDLYGLERNL